MWRVSERVYLVDTPGVMVPRVNSPGTGLKLSILGCVREGVIPSITVADYLLFLLNRRGFRGYVAGTPGLAASTQDIFEVLRREIAGNDRLSEEEAALRWVRRFRMGEFGRFCVDEMVDFENQDEGVVVEQDPDKIVETDERRIARRQARQSAKKYC